MGVVDWYRENYLRPAAGALGKAIDVVGKGLGDPFGQGWNISENLESWGGSPTGSKWTFVKPVKAAETVDWSQYQSPAIESNGSVLGEGTSNNINNTGGNTGGSLRDAFNAYRASGGYAGWDEGPAWADFQAKGGNVSGGGSGESSGPSAEDLLRESINSGWDQYIANLNARLGELPGLQEQDVGRVNRNYESYLKDLNTSNQLNNQLLGSQRGRVEERKVKNMKDIYENIRNLMFSGAKTFGDTSAAGQYTYALQRLGSKQRGDVYGQAEDQFSQIADREAKLQGIYTQEKNRLQLEKQNAIDDTVREYQNARRQIQDAIANGELGRQQDIQQLLTNALNQAMTRLDQINTQISQRNSALDQWAISNSQNLAQVKQNLQGVANYKAPLWGYNRLSQGQAYPNYSPGGSYTAPIGFGFSSEDEKKWL